MWLGLRVRLVEGDAGAKKEMLQTILGISFFIVLIPHPPRT